MFPIEKCCHKLGPLFFAVLACFAASELQAETAVSDQPVAVIAPAQIEQWISQLDDDRFIVRQRAQQQIEQAGQPALEAIAEVALTGSLESSTRAINILLSWAEAPQQVFRLAVLQKLVRLPHRPRESAMATRLLADAREQIAIAEITKLGGRVKRLGDYNILQVIIDKNWKGGDAGMKHLAEVRHVVKISLWVAPITDSALESLINLPQVQVIEVHGTKVSDEALKKMKLQMPTTIIDFHDGPMLGIHGDANDRIKGSVAVDNVVENGAAHKAGILPGDRITELNGEKLNDFTALTKRIAKHQPGDKVTLTLLRKKKSLTVQVTFDVWGATDNTKLLLKNKRATPQKQPLQGLPIQVPPR